MNRIYDFLINTEAEKDELIIRFNDLMPNAQNKLSKILKNGSSIYKIRKSNIPAEKVKSILRINNPIIWQHWNLFNEDHQKLACYPIFRFKERALSRIIYYAIKETPITNRQKNRIQNDIETDERLIRIHRMRNGLMTHTVGTCGIYNCPICKETDASINSQKRKEFFQTAIMPIYKPKVNKHEKTKE